MHYACALPDAADIEEILSAAGADDVAQDDVSLIPADNNKQSAVTGQLLELAPHLFEISNILISYPVKFWLAVHYSVNSTVSWLVDHGKNEKAI